jgi:uncharacterized protein
MVDREEIEALVERIAAAFRLERVILFGSYARGTLTPGSDVDLLIVLPFEGKAWQVATEIRRRARPTFPVDLLVRSPEQVRERASRQGTFLHEVLREGGSL